jgi:hypothetical protein
MRTIFVAGFLPRLGRGFFSLSGDSPWAALASFGFGGEPIVPVFGLNCNSFFGFVGLLSAAGST